MLGFLKLIGLPIILIFGFWLIDHRAFQRGRGNSELATAALVLRDQEFSLLMKEQLDLRFEEQFKALNTQLANIQSVETTIIQPTLRTEISRETRFSDPSAGITDGMLRSINQARDLSSDADIVSGSPVALPSPTPPE